MSLIRTLDRIINILQSLQETVIKIQETISVVTLKGSFVGQGRYFITIKNQTFFLDIRSSYLYKYIPRDSSQPNSIAADICSNAIKNYGGIVVETRGLGKNVYVLHGMDFEPCISNPDERIFTLEERKIRFSSIKVFGLNSALGQDIIQQFDNATPRQWNFELN
jgi:hypothetical protein